jgi:uncharacterized protein YukE
VDEKTLYVDLEVLKSKVSVLTKLERSLSEVENTLNVLAGNAGSFWEGSAFNVFETNQKKLQKDVGTLKSQVSQERDNLNQAVMTYERVEKNVDTIVENLSTVDIF